VVAFHDIKGEIYGKARERAADLTANDSSEGEDDGWNSDDDQEEERGPMGEDMVFDLDEAINLDSSFLQDMLSDKQTPPTSGDTTTLTTTTSPSDMEAEDGKPTEDDWENV
jgi:hypothetical protein